jgi:molybdate transport system substrate-binding protein
MMKTAVPALSACILAVILVACGPQPAPQGSAPAASSSSGAGSPVASPQPVTSPAAAAQAGELRVFAAASLTDAFTEIGKTFESQNPGSTIVFNFGPSTGLRTQIENGATADVFASADQSQMERARSAGLIAGEPQSFANNVLILITPVSNPGNIQTIQDLARPGIRLVMTNAQVPVGAYTLQMLESLSKDPAYGADFSQRVRANVRSEEEDVRSLVAKVNLEEADAGIVYVSDVTPQVAARVRTIQIPDAYNVIAAYPIAVVKDAKQPDLAARFIQLVLSDAGQNAIAKWGLRRAR